MELWMARQEGLQEMYQNRVANPNRVKTMEEDIEEQTQIAQKSMSIRKSKTLSTQQDISGYKSLVQKTNQITAAKFRVEKDDESDHLWKQYVLSSALKIISGCIMIFTSWTWVTIPIAASIFFISKIIDTLLKATEIDYLFSTIDTQKIAKIMADGNKHKAELSKYKTWAEVPVDLQDSTITWAEDTFRSMKNLKNAIVLEQRQAKSVR